MVKFNSKRLLAVIVASTMVIGSSVTAFADDTPVTSRTADGAGTYEGNIPAFGAPSVSLPTIASGAYDYIADPNGLIQKTESSHYASTTWEGDGVYFLKETGKRSGTSAPMELINNSAYSVDLTVTMEQKASTTKKNVNYSADKTFEGSSAKEIYLAITDGTNTSAITQKDAGDAVANTVPAKLNVTIKGKPSNYTLTESSGSYSLVAKDGATWNKASITAVGALNKKTNWYNGADDEAIVWPQVTVTYGITTGAAPVFIKDGVAQDVTLSHKGNGVTISKIAYADTAVPSTMYEATAIDGSKAATLTLKSGFTAYAYPKAPADGLVFTVTYSDDFQETFTCVKW